MFAKTFNGGVHPKAHKELSENSQTVRLEAKGELTYLMNQHIGAPAKPLVSVGDRVLLGQTIAEAGGFVSASVAASVSGVVKAVGLKMTQSGDEAMAITVENDCEYEAVEGFGAPRDYASMSKEEIREAIRNAGIVGMGGAGFPTAVKVAVKDDSKIDYIICNGAECEPYITCDYRLMLEKPNDAVTGMKILLKLFESASGVFGIENNKPAGIAAVAEACAGSERISVVPLKKKYPQGGERMLIKAITGRKINSKMLPADAGCVVVNYSTLIAVADAVTKNIPLVRRVVTVTGDAIKNPSNFDVPIGISASELIEAAGGYTEEPEKLIFGGPMMGAAVYTADLPITKTSSCILALKKDETAGLEPTECIRCGKCLYACPEHLMPIKLKNTADAGDYAAFEAAHGLECIGCGCCTYVCPARRRLSQTITMAKRYILAEKKKGAAK